MSIYKVNNNLPKQDQIEDLNDMIEELEGYYEQGKFNKNELDQIFSLLPLNRKYNYRNTGIGNTASTYTGWSHLKAEDGYSIWKYSPTNYTYNSNNKLYLDGKLVDNKGEANSESSTVFDTVYLYNGDSGAGYIDNTSEAGTEDGTEFNLMDSSNDYLYVGLDTTFSGIKFEFQTRGSNYTLRVEYYDEGSGVNDWVELTSNNNDLTDNTSDFESNGNITWSIPDDWGTTTVNSVSKYWIRISTTTEPVTTSKAFYIIPADSVIGLLALSSSEIENEEWSWCSYNSSIYVTIRNSGDSAYEGDYYITSSSSNANLQNFYIYNKPITADYESSVYDPVVTKTSAYTVTGSEGVILADGTFTITLPNANDNEGVRIIIKNIGNGAITIDGESGETIDGSATKSLASQYDFVELISSGSNWFIIGE